MRATLECLVENVKRISRIRGEMTTPTLERLLESTSLISCCSSRTTSQHKIRQLSLFEEKSDPHLAIPADDSLREGGAADLRFTAFRPLQFDPSFSPFAMGRLSRAPRPPLSPSSLCFQKRELFFQQTGLKQACFLDNTQDRWYLKIFVLFILSALLSNSNLALANEDNGELNLEELKEIAKDLDIEEIDDPEVLQQKCFTQLMSICLTERDPNLIKALDSKKIVKLRDLRGNSLLIASIREGASTEVIKYLICQEKALKVQSCNKEGDTPLHIAAKEGRDDLIEELWPYLNRKNNKGETPLHLAIQRDRERCVRRLQQRGARLDSLRLGNLELSPVALAVKAGAKRALRVLSSDGAGLDQSVPGCGNLLHLAVLFGQRGMVEFLFHDSVYFSKVQSLLLREDSEGRIPFTLACAKGDCDMASFLHDKGKGVLKGEDLNYRDSTLGWTPAHWAAQEGQCPIIHLLGGWGAELGARDHQGRRPENVAEEKLSGFDLDIMRTAIESAQRAQALGITTVGFQNRLPQNIVIRGGGPKGIVYIGALRALRQKGMDREIDRAAGTSAGAITVCLYALGYSSEEMEETLGRKNLLQLLDPKDETCNAILQATLTQKNTQSYVQSIRALISNGATHVLSSPRQTYRELSGMDGLCKGEDFRDWIEGLIRSQVKKVTGEDIPYLTLGGLRDLKGRGFPFKHIRLFATPVSGEKPRCFSSENKEDDQLIISDLIRASMSIPGVFEPHVLHYKDPKTGRRRGDPDGGRYVDGGLLRNFPITTYDEPDGQINRRTLGLTLKKEGKLDQEKVQDPKSPLELAKAIASIYYEAEELLQNEESNNRVIEIPYLGVSLLDFDLPPEKVKQLVQSGYDAVMKSRLFEIDLSESRNLSLRRTVRAPLPKFTGRSLEIKKLKNCLENKSLSFDRKIIVLLISGLPGMGKTELARKVIDEVLDPSDRLTYAFEIDYRDINGSYREIANKLEIVFDEKSSSEEVQRKVLFALEREEKPWFLIVNNVEGDQKVDEKLLPRSGGYVLITAHSNGAWTDPDEHIQLDTFDQEEGARLIAQITEEKMSEEIRELARRLDCYPLAIDQAARFIRGAHPSDQANDFTVKEYLDLYRDRFSLGTVPNEQRYNRTMGEVVDISLQYLKERHPKAWDWLRAFSLKTVYS